MNYKIVKMDKRHAGNHLFKYYITATYSTWVYSERQKLEKQFLEWQAWCWTTYGQGCDRDLAHHIKDSVHWAYDLHRHKTFRLYLRSDQELMMFKLRWS